MRSPFRAHESTVQILGEPTTSEPLNPEPVNGYINRNHFNKTLQFMKRKLIFQKSHHKTKEPNQKNFNNSSLPATITRLPCILKYFLTK